MSTGTSLFRHLCTALGIFVIMFFSVFSSSPANAALEGCRGDPLVLLSNGMMLRIATSISASEPNVSAIDYTLHTPRGVTVKKVIYTGGALSKKEKLYSFDDAPAGEYISDTIVTLNIGIGAALVRATTSLKQHSVSVSGSDHQHLVATLMD